MSEINWAAVLGWEQEQIDALRSVGFSYIQQGIYATALIFFDAIIVLTPPTANDLQTLGALHLQLGANDKALEHLNAALQLDPSHIPTQLNRAKALLALGQRPQAAAQARAVERQSNHSFSEQASVLLLSIL